MSIADLDKAFELIKENFDESECIFGTPKSNVLIEEAEKLLGLHFPKTYKEFIKKVGHGGPGSLLIYGILVDEPMELSSTGVVWRNIDNRNDLDQPVYLINIEDIGDGDLYCLDTSQMTPEGECPVVVWPAGGYEQTPVLEVVAEDFGRFFLDMVKLKIDHKKSSQ